MDNQCMKFEVSLATGYEGMKGDAKCRKWGGLGLLKVTGNSTIHLLECIRVPISLP